MYIWLTGWILQVVATMTKNSEDPEREPIAPSRNELPPALISNQTVDLFILAGQSNAHGYASVSTLTDSQKTQKGLFYTSWHNVTTNAESPQYYSNWAASLVAGNTRGDDRSSELGGSLFFGPELGFVSRANEIALTSAIQPMGVLKYAVGSSALTQRADLSDWDLNATTKGNGDCWRGFQRALADATTKLTNDGYSYTFKGMIWWQGESGSSATDLQVFIAAVRNLLGNAYGVTNPNTFPVVITGSNSAWGRDLESGVASLDPYVGFVNAANYGQIFLVNGKFNVHPGNAFTGPDVVGTGVNDIFEIGEAFADQMALAMAGNTVSPWDPSRTKTELWVDASDSATITLSGSNVQSITDKSGNDHALLAKGNTTISSGIQNGKDVLNLPSNTEYLESATIHTGLATGKQVWYIVASPSGVSSPQDSLWSTIGGSAITFLPNTPGFVGLWYYSNTAMGEKYSSTDLQGQYSIYVIEWDFPNNMISTWLNGNVVNKDVAADKPITFGSSNKFRFMGQYSQQGTPPNNVLDGTFAEAIISSAHAERQKIEGYLAHKWGLQDNLPSSHAYKNSAP